MTRTVHCRKYNKELPGLPVPPYPGAKGQANAAYKKATNPGKGSGKNNSVEGKLLDELIDDDKGKNKNKKNGKKKNK